MQALAEGAAPVRRAGAAAPGPRRRGHRVPLLRGGPAGTGASHPQRALLLRALDSGGTPPVPDLRLHDPLPGDRYLLCSDGLSSVVPDDRIQALPGRAADPDAAVRSLVEAANTAGGPDNVSCVVADVVEAGAA